MTNSPQLEARDLVQQLTRCGPKTEAEIKIDQAHMQKRKEMDP